MRRKKEPRISVRIPKGSDLSTRLMHALDITGLDEPTLVLRCVEAAVEYIERHGSITLPISVIPKECSTRKIIGAGITQNNIASYSDEEVRAARAAERPKKK